jgi:hypothetical protein
MLRHFLICALASCSLSAVAGAQPDTMRVDFVHSGNRDIEIFSLEQVVIEPLPWPGNPHRPIDTTLRGKYLFEIRDLQSKILTYSRSFSSIYGEWETTAESRAMNRSFEESVRFPAPERPFQLVLKKRDPANDFVEIWRIDIDPGDMLVHHESAPYRSKVIPIEVNGPSAQKVDLLILGDGYTENEHARFVERARSLSAVLFETPPFRERREDFNVWALAPAANESGISRPSAGINRDSPLGATYDAFRSERYILTFSNKKWRQVASSAPYEFVEIITNTETYGGGGIYGLFSTAAADNEWGNYLFIHEFGHHFGGLGDEYYTSDVAYEPEEQPVEPYSPNITVLADPANLKWQRFVTPGTPVPTPWPKQEYDKFALDYQARRAAIRERNAPESEMNALFAELRDFNEKLFSAAPYSEAIGAFEGAGYASSGKYRPAQQCLMFDRSTAFCPVCAAALTEVIDEYTRP